MTQERVLPINLAEYRQPPVAEVAVAVAVDNEVVRHGLTAVLRHAPGVRMCDSPPGADVVIASLRALNRDDTLARHENGRRHRLLVVLDEPDEVYAVRVLAPDGYLLSRDLTPQTLHRALVQVVEGQLAMPAELGRHLLGLAAGPARRERGRSPALTPREREALALLADGLSNRQIGRRLGVSEHGAKRLVGNIMTKLGSPNRTLAVAIAIRERLIQAEPA